MITPENHQFPPVAKVNVVIHNGVMLSFSKETAIKVWKNTEEGLKADYICSELPVGIRTVERLRKVRTGFIKNRTDEKLVTKEWSISTIGLLRSWWINRELVGNRLSKEEHLKDLIYLAKSIRRCIERPNLDEEPDYHQLMNVRGYDWRLDPVMWFYLCAPDLSKTDSWGTDPALLKSHIESNPLKKSPFWAHLDQLWQKVKALENNYDKMAVEIMSEDGEFKKYWESIQLERVKREKSEGAYKPSRTPLSLTLINDIRPYYDESKVDEVIDKFMKTDFILSVHQSELEEMLNQLYKDLNPTVINPLIVDGHCGECP